MKNKKIMIRKAREWQERSAYYYELTMRHREWGQDQYANPARDNYDVSWFYLSRLLEVEP